MIGSNAPATNFTNYTKNRLVHFVKFVALSVLLALSSVEVCLS